MPENLIKVLVLRSSPLAVKANQAQSPFKKVALVDSLITYYLLTKQFRRMKERSSKQCLINLHLDLVYPQLCLFYSFNSCNLIPCERRCLSCNTVSKLECPMGQRGQGSEYKCSQTKEMVHLNIRVFLELSMTFTLKHVQLFF